MARTKATARKSTVRTTPSVSSDGSSDSNEPAQGTKRPLETDIVVVIVDAPPPPVAKKQRLLGNDPLLRNRIHFRMHSIAEIVLERYPSMTANADDRAIERAKHGLIEELEAMFIDEE